MELPSPKLGLLFNGSNDVEICTRGVNLHLINPFPVVKVFILTLFILES